MRVIVDYRERLSGMVELLAKHCVVEVATLPYGGYRPKKLKTSQLYLLQGLPEVGPKLAKRLLNHFHAVGRIMSTTVDELMEVRGVGRSKAGKIREVLD